MPEPGAGQEHAGHQKADPHAERRIGQVLHGADGRQRDDEPPDEHRVRERADADTRAEEPGERHDEDADDDVRPAEGERRVLGDALVQDVPRRQAEPGLEKGDDAEREQEQTAHENAEPEGEAAAKPWRRPHTALI